MNKIKNIIKRIIKDSINNLNKLFKATLNISIMFILFIVTISIISLITYGVCKLFLPFLVTDTLYTFSIFGINNFITDYLPLFFVGCIVIGLPIYIIYYLIKYLIKVWKES